MSATGRTRLDGTTEVRHPDDFYETPAWCVEAILPHLKKVDHVFDPCAGRGAILDAVEAVWGIGATSGFELDPERADAAGVKCADALAAETWGVPDLIITNPPYRLALEFVDQSLRRVQVGGEVAMLLRINWLAGKARRDFHKAHPCDVCVLSKRPSFTGRGTDATEYAWMVWGSGRGNRWCIL